MGRCEIQKKFSNLDFYSRRKHALNLDIEPRALSGWPATGQNQRLGRVCLMTYIREPLQGLQVQGNSSSRCLFTSRIAVVISKKMPSRCVVGDCSNNPNSEEGITLHIIPYFGDDRPLAKSRRKRWIQFVKTKRSKWSPSASSAVCSRHFLPTDYIDRYNVGVNKRKSHLMRDETGIVPVPTIHVHVGEQDENIEEQMLSNRSRRTVSFEVYTFRQNLVEFRNNRQLFSFDQDFTSHQYLSPLWWEQSTRTCTWRVWGYKHQQQRLSYVF